MERFKIIGPELIDMKYFYIVHFCPHFRLIHIKSSLNTQPESGQSFILFEIGYNLSLIHILLKQLFNSRL